MTFNNKMIAIQPMNDNHSQYELKYKARWLASLLRDIALHTVEKHRRTSRAKLELTKTKISLYSHLNSM